MYRKVRQKNINFLYGKKQDWPAQPCFVQWLSFFPYFLPWPVTRWRNFGWWVNLTMPRWAGDASMDQNLFWPKFSRRRYRAFTWMYTLYLNGLPPTQDASHHQDYEPFLVGNPNLNLHLPLESWVGGRSNVYLTNTNNLEMRLSRSYWLSGLYLPYNYKMGP